jgi:hypothetical protein
MKALTKTLTGAAAAALITVSAAAPAQAQYRGYGYDRDDGIDAGDVITGVAVIGGIAAILGAFDRDGDRYGHDNRYRHRNDYQAAVNGCAYEAQRYARGGRVQVSDVDQVRRNRYRVRGVVESQYDYRGGYDRYDRYDRGNDRVAFECDVRANGRILDFDVRRY